MNHSEKLTHVERTIGYVFKVKSIGIESINSDGQPIYYESQWHRLKRNNYLAIIGD